MRRIISRRDFLKAAGATAAAAALAACQRKVEPTEISEVASKPATNLVNALGMTLPLDALPLDQQDWLLSTGEIGSGLSAWGAYGHSMESMYNHAYEPGKGQEILTSLDANNNVIPIGCESFKMSDDGLYWDFKLRKELIFSDDKPLTAHDWVYTLRRSLGNGYDFGWFYYDILNAADVTEGRRPPEELGIEAVDDYTLRIRSAAPCPHLPALGVWLEVAPPQAYEKYGDNWSLEPEHFISSGPFTLVGFERGVKYLWELNPKYKGINRPYITKIRGERLPTGLPSYITGALREYMLSMDTPAAEVGMVNANPILRSESHPQPPMETHYIGFNTLGGEFAPLDNPDVRMALCKAVDKATLVNEIGRGFASPAWGILPPGFPNYAGEQMKVLEPNVFDVEAARALLSKAGYANGKGFPKLEFWMRGPTTAQLSLCQAIQAQWMENLGVEVELVPADWQAFTDKAFGEKKAAIYYVGYMLDYYDPSTFLGVFRTDGGRHPHLDPKFDEFYLNSVSTLNLQKRAELLVEAEKMLVNSTAYFFLWSPFTINLWPCYVKGPAVEPNSEGFQRVAPPVAAGSPYTGLYLSDSKCRVGLK